MPTFATSNNTADMGRRRKPFTIDSLSITDTAKGGKGVGRDTEGRVIFVEDTVPGDVAEVLAYKKKKSYFLAQATKIHQHSPHRQPAFCQHFDHCGGCRWQHFNYAAQLHHKEKEVRNQITRIGKVEVGQWEPILGASRSVYYRNKLEYTFSTKRWLPRELLNSDLSNEQDVLGFHASGAYDKIIDIDHCWLQPEPSNAIRNTVRELAQEMGLPFFDIRANTGFLRTMIIRISSLGQVMLVFSIYKDEPDRYRPLFDALIKKFPQISSLGYCINAKGNDTIFDLEVHNYFGKPYLEERLGHVQYRIGPKSFFQTNTEQAKALYDLTLDYAGLSGTENVYDLYTGIGSIALYAAKACKQVVGIEEIPAAIEDAKVNAAINGIENAIFYAGDVKDVLDPAFAQKHGRPDVLITDPPRAGMHPKVVQYLIDLAAPRMVYVSCNAATQARDLELLSGHYSVERSRAVDLFPHTDHVENVVLLERRSDSQG